MNAESRKQLFRKRGALDASKVTNIELFFDLVFVFAITQLSTRLLTHLTITGGLETLVLFLAIWWLWIYTSWATNWLDPERGAVRFMLLAMMLGGLVMSAALPTAFAGSGMVFAGMYVAMQLLRTLAIAAASIGINRDRMRNFLRLAFYFLMAAPFWIAGAWSEPMLRLALWVAALAIEYLGPVVLFATPFLGHSKVSDWDISGEHMAERCSLFVIIALGEAILATGATFAGLSHDAATSAAFVASFLGSAAMWWIYFDTGAKRASEMMAKGNEVGRLGRNAYTYAHMPIVGAVVVTAVADELMLAHPLGQVVRHAAGQVAGQAVEQTAGPGGLPFVLVACGGAPMFLVGNQIFKWMTAERPNPPLSHFIGAALLVATAAAALLMDWVPLVTGSAATASLLVTAIWEWFSLNGGWRRWSPWIGRGTAIALEESER